ncbi:hypothetical protein CEXT_757691 [Caerostris extrusa]|uniref:Uncharacterized protein n=1 Tax=Caerostris extrusa TaxID=172846 RepID=A0AAV4YF85_CAEEX|nr:hypothetical protein CEXT_757691 [Caerostris extrusa]
MKNISFKYLKETIQSRLSWALMLQSQITFVRYPEILHHKKETDGLNNGDESVGGKKSINKPRSSSTSCVMHAKSKEILRRSPGDQWALPVADSPEKSKSLSAKNLMQCSRKPCASCSNSLHLNNDAPSERRWMWAFGKLKIFPSSAGTTLFERAIVAEAEISAATLARK